LKKTFPLDGEKTGSDLIASGQAQEVASFGAGEADGKYCKRILKRAIKKNSVSGV